MKEYKAYLIDLDGTMYRGAEVIPEAIIFIENLKRAGIPYLFVTNNSTKTPGQVAEHLSGMGIQAVSDDVFTTSQATVQYMLEHKREKTVYVIGERGIKQELTDNGFEITSSNPDFVVVGLDREVDYEKFAKAALAVRSGAMFISTNGDAAIPTERGLLPGNGSITSVVSVATETAPIFIGKPESIIMEQALTKLGVQKDEAIMVGDNYETDIMAGINYGMDTLIVHTGFTSKEALKTKEIQPTYAVTKLTDWKFN